MVGRNYWLEYLFWKRYLGKVKKTINRRIKKLGQRNQLEQIERFEVKAPTDAKDIDSEVKRLDKSKTEVLFSFGNFLKKIL